MILWIKLFHSDKLFFIFIIADVQGLATVIRHSIPPVSDTDAIKADFYAKAVEFVLLIELAESKRSIHVSDALAVFTEEITCLVSGLLKLQFRPIIKFDYRIYVALPIVENSGGTDLVAAGYC